MRGHYHIKLFVINSMSYFIVVKMLLLQKLHFNIYHEFIAQHLFFRIEAVIGKKMHTLQCYFNHRAKVGNTEQSAWRMVQRVSIT